MSDGDFRRPPMLWEQRLAQRVDVNTVGLGISATYEVPEAPAPGDGAPGTDPEVPQPPPAEFAKPSTPVLTGAVQGIRVYWDGLTAAGSTFPVGAAWVEVHSATSGTGFTVGTATLKGRMDYPGEFYLGGLSAGTTYYVRLRGADPQGNYTDASDGVGGQTGVTSSNDYGTATITEGAVSFNARTIGGVTNTVGSVTPTSPVQGDVWLDTSPGTAVIHKVYNGSTWVTNAWGSASIAAGQITALQIATGAVTAGAIAAGEVVAGKLSATAIDGMTITGSTIRTGTNAGGADAGSKAGVVINSSGLYGYNSGGTQTISINASTGAVTIGAIAGTDLIGTAQVNGNVTSISGNVITTGTINANRILAGTLNASIVDVTNLDASKITAGILSGREIRTSAGGSRIVLADGNTDTLAFYSGGGTVASIRGETAKLVLDVGASSEVRVSGKLQVNSTSNFDGSIVVNGNTTTTGDLTVTDEVTAARVSTEGNVVSLNAYRTTATAGDTVIRVRSNVGTTAGTALEIHADGDVFNKNDSYGVLSDVALKENIQPARQYLEDLRQIEIVKYNLIGHQEELLGVTAQQVESVFPRLVPTLGNGHKAVRMSVFVPMLITAVQELADKVDDLTARIEALEG